MSEEEVSMAMHLNQNEFEYGTALHGIVRDHDKACEDREGETEDPLRERISITVEGVPVGEVLMPRIQT